MCTYIVTVRWFSCVWRGRDDKERPPVVLLVHGWQSSDLQGVLPKALAQHPPLLHRLQVHGQGRSSSPDELVTPVCVGWSEPPEEEQAALALLWQYINVSCIGPQCRPLHTGPVFWNPQPSPLSLWRCAAGSSAPPLEGKQEGDGVQAPHNAASLGGGCWSLAASLTSTYMPSSFLFRRAGPMVLKAPGEVKGWDSHSAPTCLLQVGVDSAAGSLSGDFMWRSWRPREQQPDMRLPTGYGRPSCVSGLGWKVGEERDIHSFSTLGF